MSYTRLNLQDGVKFNASHVSHMEDGIEANSLLLASHAELLAKLSAWYDEAHATPLEGDGQNYHQFAPTALTFRSTEPLEEFKEVQVNGETVDPENYTLEEGSTIVTLKPEYLKTLGGGKYEIAIVSQNKTTSGKFDVTVPELNEYGFYYNQPYVAIVYALGDVLALIFKEDGTLNVIGLDSKSTETCTYTIDENILTVLSSLGELQCTVSPNGISCAGLGVTFVLGAKGIDGAEGIVSDGEYLYVPFTDNGVDGYMLFNVIDRNKDKYGSIKTGINGKPTIYIENKTFENFTNIKEIVIPSSILNFGDYVFNGCINLEKVVFEKGSQLGSIAHSAFENCTAINSIELPNGMTIIYSRAFSGCSNLRTVIIPNSINDIEHYAFANCINLSELIFEGTVEQWNSIPLFSDANKINYPWNYNVPATYVQCADGQVPLV